MSNYMSEIVCLWLSVCVLSACDVFKYPTKLEKTDSQKEDKKKSRKSKASFSSKFGFSNFLFQFSPVIGTNNGKMVNCYRIISLTSGTGVLVYLLFNHFCAYVLMIHGPHPWCALKIVLPNRVTAA